MNTNTTHQVQLQTRARRPRREAHSGSGLFTLVAGSCSLTLALILAPGSVGAVDGPTPAWLEMSPRLENPDQVAAAETASATEKKSGERPAVSSAGPLIKLGVGDTVSVQVYGKPELATTTYVADDGTLTVPLAGAVQVLGVSPSKAAQRIASAFRNGNFLVDPQVTVFLVLSRSQQVSVLGAVKTPGRFAVDSRTTVLDLLAQAGGVTETGDMDSVVLIRPDKDGQVRRTSVDLSGLSDTSKPLPTIKLRGGDSIFVPPAAQFFIHGEVKLPNMYRLEPGMTVVQAISRGGGVSPRGSASRVEIKRRKPDGEYVTRSAQLNEPVKANDVIRVKESIF